MKASLKWLKDYVNITLPVRQTAEKLTMAGLESEAIEIRGGEWENIIIGQVVALEPHPNADRLQLATVNLKSEQTEQITVVCGAPNLRAGDKVAFARVGAHLIDGHSGQKVELKRVKIRGVASEGMVCSEKELGISDNYEGALILPSDVPVGIPLSDYLGDAVFDLEVTPNRPDCLSIIGIAREIAVLTGQRLELPSPQYIEEGSDIRERITVDITAPELCRRYCASLVEGVTIAPSPLWMQERLLACGMRPINNIVDITNYVMLEYGQPLHAFDCEAVSGRKIIVRRAGEGETITTIDGMRRALTPEMLVIANEKCPVAIAGVMGGADSEVGGITSTVLLESASFLPLNIRRTSASLHLGSEASFRFERGISPELTLPALQRATQLMVELAGGRAAKGIIDVYPDRVERSPITFSASQIEHILGMKVDLEEAKQVLTALGFQCKRVTPSELRVIPPYWRTDVNMVADVVEEISRIMGYDRIPVTMLSSPLPHQQPAPALDIRERLRDLMVGCGFQEIISYSMVSRERAGGIEPIHLANPMNREQEYLRTTLLPNLVASLALNQRHSISATKEENSIRIFEVGKVYLPRDKDLPYEEERLAAVLSGPRAKPSWQHQGITTTKKGYLDFFDAKGVIEEVMRQLTLEAEFKQIPLSSSSGRGDLGEFFHPGRTALVELEGERIGVVGEIHPQLADRFDLLPQTVTLFELEIEKLISYTIQDKRYRSIPRFPEIVRDIAVVVDSDIPAGRIENAIRESPLVVKVTLFDLYSGEPIAKNKKSLAFRVAYQSAERTLTNAEVDEAEQIILKQLSDEVGATLRS